MANVRHYRVRAAERLLEQCFNLESWEEEGPDLVGKLVERSRTFEVVFGDVGAAVIVMLSEIKC